MNPSDGALIGSVRRQLMMIGNAGLNQARRFDFASRHPRADIWCENIRLLRAALNGIIMLTKCAIAVVVAAVVGTLSVGTDARARGGGGRGGKAHGMS